MEKYMFTIKELKVIGDAASILTDLQDEHPEIIEAVSTLWVLYNEDGGTKREYSEVK